MSSRIKLLMVILVPILLGTALTTAAMWLGARETLDERARHFGNAIVDQLALTVTDPLLRGDVLSLNVILNELHNRGDVSFATVYDADDRLMAQAGRATEGLAFFSRDVTFQNTKTGYVQLGLDTGQMKTSLAALVGTGVSIVAALTVFLALVLWRYGDLLYLWLSPELMAQLKTEPPATPSPDEAQGEASNEETAAEESSDEPVQAASRTLLVLKIQPLRLLDEHEPTIMQALALYGGDVEITEGDDIVATFERADQVLKAACAATLVRSLMERARGRIMVKAGLHVVDEDVGQAELRKARKQATYLSSIADNRLLASRRVFEASRDSERLGFEPYHSSLTPDGEVYILDHIQASSRALIDKQAEQLTR